MGLDMYLYSFEKNNQLVTAEDYMVKNFDDSNGTVGVIREIGYWRKANQIHAWFVQSVQGGDDSCEPYFVKKEDLEKLKNLSVETLRLPPFGQFLLPTADGFFFGGSEYDEYYYKEIENTIKIIDTVFEQTDFDKNILIYQSSW